MRSTVASALVLVALAALASPARADRAIRLGTVGKGVDRAGVEAALDGAFRQMTPCFRRASGVLEVKVDVGADGEVTSASGGKGAAAQCAAGILAVTKFPAGAWKTKVEIDAVSAEDWLQQRLASHQAELSACQTKDAAGKGQVVLALAIAKDGSITSATVDKTTASKAIADCAKTTALAFSLGALPGGADVKYKMSLSYTGGSSHGAGTTPSKAGTPGTGGSAKGALGGGDVQKAWAAGNAKVMACGAKLTVQGGVDVAFAIRANGTVKNVVVSNSTIDNKKVEDCVDEQLRAMTFPTASGETQVKIPIKWEKR
jgi:hypothetical protein